MTRTASPEESNNSNKEEDVEEERVVVVKAEETVKENDRQHGRKRLSRKEQKALRKNKKQKQQHQQQHQPPLLQKEKNPEEDIDYNDSYVPTPLPADETESAQQQATATKQQAKALGKWFPKAVIHKSIVQPPSNGELQRRRKRLEVDSSASCTTSNTSNQTASLVLFYQYASPPWSEAVVQRLLTYLGDIASHRALGGRIRVAREGVNATVSSVDNIIGNGANCASATTTTSISSAAQTLRHFALDLQNFDDIFQETDFKYIDNLSPDRHFTDLKLFPVKELVFYGFEKNNSCVPAAAGGVHLEPREFHAKLGNCKPGSTVVVDVRNHYEAAIGRFDGQEQHEEGEQDGSSGGGALYVDPKMRKSTDFCRWLQQPETQQTLANKEVLLYCTGGVRCERASAHLQQQMGSKVKGVYQLKGGVERYLQEFKHENGGHWRGKNFVFDKREAISVENPDGDGGVLVTSGTSGSKKKKAATSSTSTAAAQGILPECKCCICAKPWDRYVGKKKCTTCGVPVLICDICLSTSSSCKQKKKQEPKEQQLKMRCPLCVEENVTVPADEVEWTNNGLSGRLVGGGSASASAHASEVLDEGGIDNDKYNKVDSPGAGTQSKSHAVTAADHKPKVAPSILKWGGGHAAGKKDRRWLKRKPCHFGADCVRKDCFFAHPPAGRREEQQMNKKRADK